MQHLDNIGDYDESDFDDYHSTNPKKPYSVEETLEHHFDYTDAYGEDQQLYTEIYATYKVVPGSYSYDAPSDLDYQGYAELQEWVINTCISSTESVVQPKEVLTPEQFQEYTLDLINFIEG